MKEPRLSRIQNFRGLLQALKKDAKSSSLSKSQEKRKKDARDGGQYTVPSGPKCFGCQGFGHMKQECLSASIV